MIEVGLVGAVAGEVPYLIHADMVDKDWLSGTNSGKEKQGKMKKECHIMFVIGASLLISVMKVVGLSFHQ